MRVALVNWLRALGLLLLVAAPPAFGCLLYSWFGENEPTDVVLLKEGTHANIDVVSIDDYVKDAKAVFEHLPGGSQACRIVIMGGGRIYVDGGKARFEEADDITGEIAWQLAQCIISRDKRQSAP